VVREYLKDKIKKLATNSNSRGINEFKKGCQPRNNLVKEKNGDLLADSCNILNGWKIILFSVIECASGLQNREYCRRRSVTLTK
jgi:hypothetical protein